MKALRPSTHSSLSKQTPGYLPGEQEAIAAYLARNDADRCPGFGEGQIDEDLAKSTAGQRGGMRLMSCWKTLPLPPGYRIHRPSSNLTMKSRPPVAAGNCDYCVTEEP